MGDVTEIKEHIIKNFLFGDASKLDEKASLLDQGILDSTGVMELVALVEDKYKVKVEDNEIIPENFDTLDNIQAYIARKCGG